MKRIVEILNSCGATLKKKLNINIYRILGFVFIAISIVSIILFIIINKSSSGVLNNKHTALQETLVNDSINDPIAPIEIEEIDIYETQEETQESIEVQEIEASETESAERTLPIFEGTDEYSYDIYHVARVVWGEARGCSKLEQSAVVWCVLNRYDAGYGSIYNIITAPKQFAYMYVEPGTEILDLTRDVFERYWREQAGEIDVGRTLPKEYRYFWGDDFHNYFRINEKDQVYWDWSLPNPYEE